jgi:diadenosine tetraphosphate (Ap4A) HIT family hydrolase
MSDFSEQQLKSNCPHCDPNSFALKHPLEITDDFWVVCDVHPLCAGHILIIPKTHLSCIGEYPYDIFQKFVPLYDKFLNFINAMYGSVSSFEHGKIGQTVFHSHVHILPFKESADLIIPEGNKYLTSIENITELKSIYQNQGKYLFFTINDKKWVVDPSIGASRFFRDRFAAALGNRARGNWKLMHDDPILMEKACQEIKKTEIDWLNFKQNII